MKTRLVLLPSLCATAAFGQYAYNYVKNRVVVDSTRWISNGAVLSFSIGATFSGSAGGSLISAVPISVETVGGVSGGANDYEVTSTLALNSGGGNYIQRRER